MLVPSTCRNLLNKLCKFTERIARFFRSSPTLHKVDKCSQTDLRISGIVSYDKFLLHQSRQSQHGHKMDSEDPEIVCLKQIIFLNQVVSSLRTDIANNLVNTDFERSQEHMNLLRKAQGIDAELLLLHARVITEHYDSEFVKSSRHQTLRESALYPDYLSSTNLARHNYLESEIFKTKHQPQRKKLRSSTSKCSGSDTIKAVSNLSAVSSPAFSMLNLAVTRAKIIPEQVDLTEIEDKGTSQLSWASRVTEGIGESISGITVGKILVTGKDQASLTNRLTQTMVDAAVFTRFHQAEIKKVKLISSFMMTKVLVKYPMGTLVPRKIKSIPGNVRRGTLEAKCSKLFYS